MKWTLEQTKAVQTQHGLSEIKPCEFWVVMNGAYNDYHDIFEEDLEMYVKYAKDFIKDEDAKEGTRRRYSPFPQSSTTQRVSQSPSTLPQ